jgi:hypothetical protein
MTTTHIKDLHQAKPFKAFEIHVADGEILRVPHPELLWIHPGDRTLFVARGPREEDGTAIVDLLLVTKLVTSNGSSKGKGRNGA